MITVRKETLGPWQLVLQVGPTGRFILRRRHHGEISWDRSKFFSSIVQADHEFFKWRDETLVELALHALGVKP